MLKKTMTTKECLHRFCSDCIITALRSGNKECPTCRKKLVSKRSLRPDPNFDCLISVSIDVKTVWIDHYSSLWRILENLSKPRWVRSTSGESPGEIQQKSFATSFGSINLRRHKTPIAKSTTASAQRTGRGRKFPKRNRCVIEQSGWINTTVF